MQHLKRYLKEKNTKLSLIIESCLVVLFILTFLNPIKQVRGIRDGISNKSVDQYYSNNYLVVYAVSNDGYLYYSYNKLYEGHLNEYAGLEDLALESTEVINHEYNYIKINYNFDEEIIKVDGKNDDPVSGRNGYTIVLTRFGRLFAIKQAKQIVELENNVIDFDVSDDCLVVLKSDNTTKKYVFDQNVFKLQEETLSNIKHISAQSNEIVFYVDQDNQIYKNEEKQEISIDVKMIISHDKATFILSNNNRLYVYGSKDTYGLLEEDYNMITLLPHNFTNIENMYVSGIYGIVIKADNEYYYKGSLSSEFQSSEFKQIKGYEKYQMIANRSSVFVIKNGVILRYDTEKNVFSTLYENFWITIVVRYLTGFIIVMILLYQIIAFYEKRKLYIRYRNVKEVLDEND